MCTSMSPESAMTWPPIPPRPAARPEHQLRGVHAAGELQQGGGDVVPDDLVIAAVQALHQRPLGS
jgi:hypothetical protein